MRTFLKIPISISFMAILLSCGSRHAAPPKDLIAQLHLKRGNVISCGSPDKNFGTARFPITGSENTRNDFAVALELLHSFEYDEAEKVFAKIIDAAPQCAMAYWGVAMCSYHPLWEPPSETDLQKGARAIAIAGAIPGIAGIETGFIAAVAAYYKDWQKTDAHTRSIHFEKAMQQLTLTWPQEKEASIFYALALDAAADPADKSFSNQRKAGAMLQALYAKDPNHPGIVHYIIHTYDYPGLATLALPAAERYAAVAPSSAHAQHMPSHIFTRLGLWDEAIRSNLQSISSAQCYARSAGLKGHWDEELHGMDYLVYAYLQKRQNDSANQQLKYLSAIQDVYPLNFKVAYAYAAIPSRIALENKNWNDAALIQLHPGFPWNKFPWQESIVHFTRLLGLAHTGNIMASAKELAVMYRLRDTLQKQKDLYKTRQVQIQITAGEAWLDLAKGKKEAALTLMKTAADMEDSTTKHPVTPGEVLPARELYADMLLQTWQYENAALAYQAVLRQDPNRFNSLAGLNAANTARSHTSAAPNPSTDKSSSSPE